MHRPGQAPTIGFRMSLPYEPSGNFKSWKFKDAKGFNSVNEIIFRHVSDGVGNSAHIYIISEKKCALLLLEGRRLRSQGRSTWQITPE